MKQKIFEALKAKFQGGNASVLNRIAEKLAKTVTTDEQVATAVSGVTQELIEVIESYGDSRATEAQQTAVSNYESKYGLKEGKPTTDGGAAAGGNPNGGTTVQTPPAGGAEPVPTWAQQLIDSNKTLTERLNKMEGDNTTSIRKQQLATIINKLPEKLRKPYERVSVDTLTDEQFTSLVGEVTTEVDGLAGEIAAKGAVFSRPSAGGGGNQGNGLTKEQQEAISHRDTVSAGKDAQPF